MNGPIRILSKKEKWTAKAGGTTSPKGVMTYKAYQRATGKNKHSAPVGRLRTRFYQGRCSTGPKTIKR